MAINIALQPICKKKIISIQKLKNSYAQKYPNSPITQILLSMLDEVESDELIGAVGVWLNILDMERANNLKGGK
jgi:hypothetical protein